MLGADLLVEPDTFPVPGALDRVGDEPDGELPVGGRDRFVPLVGDVEAVDVDPLRGAVLLQIPPRRRRGQVVRQVADQPGRLRSGRVRGCQQHRPMIIGRERRERVPDEQSIRCGLREPFRIRRFGQGRKFRRSRRRRGRDRWPRDRRPG